MDWNTTTISADTMASCTAARADAETMAARSGRPASQTAATAIRTSTTRTTARIGVGVTTAGLAAPRRSCRPQAASGRTTARTTGRLLRRGRACLLYTSDAADDLTRVDLGGS